MLDIGFSELLLILAAAIVLLRPRDMPAIIRTIVTCVRQLKEFTAGVRAQCTDVVRELEATTTIIDLEGKPQQAYDVKDLAALTPPKEPS